MPIIPDTMGDVEPIVPDEVVVPVQLSPAGYDEIAGPGMVIPEGTERVQLVQQPNGNYGIRFLHRRPED